MTALDQLREFESHCEAVPRYREVLSFTPYHMLTGWWLELTEDARRFFSALARIASERSRVSSRTGVARQ